MLFADAVLLGLALYMAYLFRFEFQILPSFARQFQTVVIFAVPLKLMNLYAFGLYRGMWRYTSLGDFWKLAQAIGLATLLITFTIVYLSNFKGYSRSVFLIDGFLAFLFLGTVRVFVRRFFGLKTAPRRSSHWPPRVSGGEAPKNKAVVIGAGSAGEKLIREIHDNHEISLDIMGILDDDRSKWGRTIHGVPVLGAIESLATIGRELAVEQALIAIPSASGEQMRRITSFCKEARVPFKTLPGIPEIINGKIGLKSLRNVSYGDLLGRQEIRLDTSTVQNCIANQIVLVTGAGGSIGSELCKQLVRFNPAKLILYDAGESNLYHIEMQLSQEMNYADHVGILGPVQDVALLRAVFAAHRPSVVFHAAAYKHVPMLEKNPWQAVLNNIFASRIIMETAQNFKTERFVLVSTDKAVRPANVMGASKRASEIILQALQKQCDGTRMMAVRFGNVVGSSGSVVPLFQRQIEQGGPVTVTHPEVTRYFMTIPEAAQLILQAAAIGQGGEIFVLDMGRPVKIADMAEDLIHLSGKKPHEDIEIVFTGLRAGEKLYEELITEGENIGKTVHEKILVLHSNGMAGLPFDQQWLDQELAELYVWARKHDLEGIKEKLLTIVPEYSPAPTKNPSQLHE